MACEGLRIQDIKVFKEACC